MIKHKCLVSAIKVLSCLP